MRNLFILAVVVLAVVLGGLSVAAKALDGSVNAGSTYARGLDR